MDQMQQAPVAADGQTSNATGPVVEALTQALADLTVEQMKTQNFHWNVEGMSFGSLHELFETMYKDHFEAIDTVAERIKALGAHAEGRHSAYLKRTAIRESDGRIPDTAMVAELSEDQRTLSKQFRTLAEVAEEHGDMVTNDMAIGRAETHDKFAWMLSAHLRGRGEQQAGRH